MIVVLILVILWMMMMIDEHAKLIDLDWVEDYKERNGIHG